MAGSQGEGDLIAAIYDAVIDPSRWDEIVKRIVEATKSVSGGLFIQQAGAAQLSAVHNVDPFYANAFVQTWYKDNPFLGIADATAPGELGTATSITQSDKFKASAYFHEFISPQGWADTVGVGLLREPNSSGHLNVHRSPDAVWVEPAEWQLLETLAPHLRRAAELHQLLARTRSTTDSLGAAVAAAGFAVFLLTGDCRVVFANAKAEDLVRRGIGLRYEHGRLAAASPALTAHLHALARQATSPKTCEAHAGGTIELCRGENRPPLLAHVIPLAPIRSVAIFDLNRPATAVFVVDPTNGLDAQIQRFSARFGLTPAEIRVLAEIIAGNGLPAAAARLKISRGTVRIHTYRIFEKTGTNRQTELIRRFFETSLPGSPGGA
ncbi:MAG: helix-turn-helix transcriptional regulator [Methylocella sp.]